MLQFAANISTLYTDKPFIERIEAAAKDGFLALECQFPYLADVGISLHELKDKLIETNLPLVLMNVSAGNWSGGDRGLASLPDRREDFKNSIAQAITYAHELKVPRVHCLAGLTQDGIEFSDQMECYLHNLSWAADEFKAAEIKLLIEPINPYDMPGYFLNSLDLALETIMHVSSDNLYLQFDAYHLHRIGENILDIEEVMPIIEHIQIADHPGRHEPGTGEIPYGEFFELLQELDYQGWIGCEYYAKNQANFLK